MFQINISISELRGVMTDAPSSSVTKVVEQIDKETLEQVYKAFIPMMWPSQEKE